MSLQNVLDLQWKEYQLNHQSRLNLTLHVFTVPLFMLGSLMLPYAFLTWSMLYGLIGLSLMMLVLAIQGFGHSREQVKPRPFASASDFILRIFAEQWVTFPKYLLSGLWKHNANSD